MTIKFYIYASCDLSSAVSLLAGSTPSRVSSEAMLVTDEGVKAELPAHGPRLWSSY